MKKLIYIVIIIISFAIINSSVRSIYDLSQKKHVVIQTKEELEKERNENARLRDQLAQVKRQDFVEEEARNKLFLVQPGETLVVLPTPTEQEGENDTQKKTDLPIWKQWVELFFGQTS